MRIVVLAWDPTGASGTSRQSTGLVGALLAAGHDVETIVHGRSIDHPAAAVHEVADAPPILPSALADDVLDALAVAARAMPVAVRRCRELPADLVVADGWATAPVAEAVARLGVPVVGIASPPRVGAGGPTAELRSQLTAAADVVLVRGAVDGLPFGADDTGRRPGPPPAAGPVLLVAPVGARREVAARLRAATGGRRVSGVWTRRPAVVVVLDPDDVDAVVRSHERGVPCLVVPGGGAAAVVEASGGGEVVADTGRAVARVATVVDDRDALRGLGGAAHTWVRAHPWGAVVDRLLDVAAGGGRPLQATG